MAGNTAKRAINQFQTDPSSLVETMSFSHIRELLTIEDPFERFFYETECIKCNWSVRELRRQVKTNLFFRSGISRDPSLLIKPTKDNNLAPALTIKDPFTFEFLCLDAKDAVSESDLEQALMDHLQEFILELGEGFCFEARQKRIVIDGKERAFEESIPNEQIKTPEQIYIEKETAEHFMMSKSWAGKLEKSALDNFSLELPWWY